MSNFNNVSFKSKLIALCLFMATVSVVIGVISFTGLRSVEEVYNLIPDKVMPKTEDANDMFSEYRRVRITLRTLGLPGITADQEDEAVRGAVKAIEQYGDVSFLVESRKRLS